MSTTTKKTAPKQATRKPAPAKGTTETAAKPTASSASVPVPKPKAKEARPEAKTLIEALTTGQTVLLKVRANGTKRSLPYYAEGSEYRARAETAAKMKANGEARWRPSQRR